MTRFFILVFSFFLGPTAAFSEIQVLLRINPGNCDKCSIVSNHEIEKLKENFDIAFLINRSDSAFEMEVLSTLYKHLPISSYVFSDSLCKEIKEKQFATYNIVLKSGGTISLLYSFLVEEWGVNSNKILNLRGILQNHFTDTLRVGEFSRGSRGIHIDKKSFCFIDPTLKRLVYVNGEGKDYQYMNYGDLNDTLMLRLINNDSSFIHSQLRYKDFLQQNNLPSMGNFGSITNSNDTISVVFSYFYFTVDSKIGALRPWRVLFLGTLIKGEWSSFTRVNDKLTKSNVAVEDCGVAVSGDYLYLRNKNGLSPKWEKSNITRFKFKDGQYYQDDLVKSARLPKYFRKNYKKGYDFSSGFINPQGLHCYTMYPAIYELDTERAFSVKGINAEKLDYSVFKDGRFPYLSIVDVYRKGEYILLLLKKSHTESFCFLVFDTGSNTIIHEEQVGSITDIRCVGFNANGQIFKVQNNLLIH